jgi:uncharacterized protein (TIGR03435 family)
VALADRIPAIAFGGLLFISVCFALLTPESVSAQQSPATASPQSAPTPAKPAAQRVADLPAAQRPLGFYAVPPKIDFDVVSFKRCAPDQFGTTKIDMPLDSDYIAYHCQPISRLIYFAYVNSVSNYNLPKGYAPWVDDKRYEFIAKVSTEDIEAWKKLTLDQRRVVMRALLADVVKLKMRLEDTPQPVYLLQVDKHGSKLKPYQPGDKQKLPDGRLQEGRVVDYMGEMEYGQAQTVGEIAGALTAHLDRMVLDRTGLTGQYNFVLPVILGDKLTPQHRWTDDSPSIAEGLADLGLKLQPATVPAEQLVVDHLDPPEEN